MSASLQSKVQTLAALLVVFSLLGVPLFYQVRADAQTSQEEASDTFFSKFFRDLVKRLKDHPDEDVEIEDAWAQRARELNPDCGAACDPGGDLDGDGMSNKDELDAGRNPACNETDQGDEYCRGQPDDHPPTNSTSPAPSSLLDTLLYYRSNAKSGQEESFSVAEVSPAYDRWEVYWNVTDYRVGTQYTVALVDDSSGARLCCRSVDTTPVTISDRGRETVIPAPSPGTHRIRVDSDALDGTWELTVRALRP